MESGGNGRGRPRGRPTRRSRGRRGPSPPRTRSRSPLRHGPDSPEPGPSGSGMVPRLVRPSPGDPEQAHPGSPARQQPRDNGGSSDSTVSLSNPESDSGQITSSDSGDEAHSPGLVQGPVSPGPTPFPRPGTLPVEVGDVSSSTSVQAPPTGNQGRSPGEVAPDPPHIPRWVRLAGQPNIGPMPPIARDQRISEDHPPADPGNYVFIIYTG
ncbi:protein TE26 [Testudinid alphaherpesvirus 3]|uniref:Protein TE26 n=1 Tax=Testudinid alphaherpesvirus 3 TaxID=2560801 RepID=A0A0K1R157_9ALPH|nr:protein TE26 [Testudinid alphaherpesvirus 3]AIU39343.1 protein TE26 [Testudinid alphaherpesvirus 3]AKV40650.1 hypothetical protein [Testudinid alphaherpesvirus 3]